MTIIARSIDQILLMALCRPSLDIDLLFILFYVMRLTMSSTPGYCVITFRSIAVYVLLNRVIFFK